MKQIPTTLMLSLPNKVIPAAKTEPSCGNSHVMKAKNVFQKEGKLYIVDPVQMKMRQQQKSQVSLLKPHVSLLKPQAQNTLPISCHPLVSDHDYAPAPVVQKSKAEQSNGPTTILTKPKKSTSVVLYLHPKERLELLRLQLEKRFAKRNFACMEAAAQYLLCRIPLISTKRNVAASAYSFVYKTTEDFDASPPLKQRSREWLRGECISHLLTSHQQLTRLNESGADVFWTIREIVAFARFHYYTPPIKPLLDTKENSSTPQIFSDLVKCELKNEEMLLFQTLTCAQPISQWLKSIPEKTRVHQINVTENHIIDVENLETEIDEDCKAAHKYRVLKFEGYDVQMAYLPPPKRLYHELQVIERILKDCGIRLEPEEINPGTLSPATHTLLAQILHSFMEKLIRQSIANKLYLQFENTLPCKGTAIDLLKITPQDIGKVIAETNELDFLTNNYLGVEKSEESEDSSSFLYS